MTYQQLYQQLLELARTYKNHKRGKKLGFCAYWVKLDPDDPTRVHLRNYRYAWCTAKDGNSGRISPADLPYRIMATADPDGMTITDQSNYEEWAFVCTPEVLAHWPSLKQKNKVYKACDNGLNRLLSKIGVSHHSNGKPDKPGMKWTFNKKSTNIFGPVRFTDEHGPQPIWDQPEKIVNEPQRLTNNRALRHAFKRLRLLTALGIQITPEQMSAHLNIPKVFPTLGRTWFSTEKYIELHQKSLDDPDEFLKRASAFDPTDHAQTLDLVARAAAINKNRGWRGAADHLTLAQGLINCGDFTDAVIRTSLRKNLHKALGVVRYE